VRWRVSLAGSGSQAMCGCVMTVFFRTVRHAWTETGGGYVRFGFDEKLNEDFIGGFYLATGSLGDSNSTNETLTNFFNRKTIGLDRGYITYQPVAHRWLQLTGGKFLYPCSVLQLRSIPT
jgi:hypothetical protein